MKISKDDTLDLKNVQPYHGNKPSEENKPSEGNEIPEEDELTEIVVDHREEGDDHREENDDHSEEAIKHIEEGHYHDGEHNDQYDQKVGPQNYLYYMWTFNVFWP